MIDYFPRRLMTSLLIFAAISSFGMSDSFAAQKKPTAKKAKPRLKLKPSLTRLADPSVAKSLNLSDEQRAKVSSLLNERVDAIARSKPEDREKVKAEYQQKLADVLTAAQLKKALTPKPIPKLIFDFRFQKWEDVLEWYATESDLSLVMDHPPQGTFNFSDSKEYSPTDALDLLNSVLLTKDFTLIRRGRMLMALDIADGVPQGVVPEIKLEDLENRGKYEIVKVKFPLGRRDVKAVNDEIEALLGRHGKAIPLPLTKQLLVQAPAGVMKAIEILLGKIPEPPAPKESAKPPKPTTPENPEFRTYELKNTDPVVGKEIVEKFFEGIKIVQHPNLAELNVYTIPSQHATIKQIFDKLENSNAPDARPRLELYPLATGNADQIIVTLKLIVKNAVMRFNPATKKLEVVGTPQEHEAIKKNLPLLTGRSPLPQTPGYRQVQTYKIKHAELSAITQTLQTIFPDAFITSDASTKNIIVFTTAEDQRGVKNIIESLDQLDKQIPYITIIPYDETPSATLISTLTKIAPQSQFTYDTDAKRFIFIGPKEELPKAEETIKLFAGTTKKEKNKLAIYPVTAVQKTWFNAVLADIQTELPGIKVMSETNPGELAIWAKPAQHEVLENVIKELAEGKTTGTQSLKGYDLKDSDGSQTITLLQKVFPTLQFIHDANTKRLLVMADEETHKKILDAIGQIVTEKEKRSFQISDIGNTDTTQLLSTLQTLVPNAKLFVDAANQKLSAMATAEEHAEIKKVIDAVKKTGPSIDTTDQVVVYRLKKADPQTTLTLLQGLFPKAKFALDAQTKSIVVVAVPKDHAGIKTLVEQVDSEEENTLQIHSLPRNLPTDIVSIFKKLVPEAQVTHDAASRRLFVMASLKDHSIVKATLDQLKPGDDANRKQQLAGYSLQNADPETATKILKSLFESIRIIPEMETRQLFIWATPEVHKSIDVIIKSIDTPGTPGSAKKWNAWSLRGLDPTVTLGILKEIFPKVAFVADSTAGTVIAKVTDNQNSEITQFIGKLTDTSDKSNRLTVRRYKAKFARVSDGRDYVQALVPDAKVVVDTLGETVTVLTTEKNHEILKEAFPLPDWEKAKNLFRVYEIESGNATDLKIVIQAYVPDAQISVSSSGKKLFANAPAEDHEKLAAIVELMQEKTGNRELRRYEIKYNGRSDVRKILLGMVTTGIVVTNEASGNNIWVLATKDEHKTVKQIVDQLEKQKERAGTEYKNYDIVHSSVANIQAAITKRHPEVEFWPSNVNNRLIIEATPKEHAAIKTMIDMLEKQNEKTDTRIEKIYSVENLTPAQAQTSLNQTINGLTFLTINQPKKLYISAEPKQHELVVKRLKQLEIANARPMNISLQKYTFQHTTADAIRQYVASRMTGITFQDGPDAKTLFSEVTKEDDLKIRDLLGQLEAAYKKDDSRKLRTFDVKNTGTSTAQSVVGSFFPRIKFLPSSDQNTILALLTDDEYRRISGIVKQLEEQYRNTKNRVPNTYEMKNISVADAHTTISNMFPQATILASNDPNKLIILALKSEHLQIKSILDRLEKESETEGVISLVTYDVENTTASNAQQVLSQRLPNVTFILTPDGSKLMAWANAKQHKEIKAIVELLETSNRPDSGRIIKTYIVRGVTVADARKALEPMFLKATFVPSTEPNKVVVTAKADDHVSIKRILEILDDDNADPTRSLKSYNVEYTGAGNAQNALSETLKNVTFIPSADGKRLMVWATAKEHKQIDPTIKALEEANRPNRDRIVKNYNIEGVTVDDIQSLLATMFPEATFKPSSKRNVLIAMATPVEHEDIAKILSDIGTKKETLTLKTYEVPNTGANNAQQVLSLVLPQVKFTVGNDKEKLFALATAEDHKSMAGMVDELEFSGVMNRKMKVYKAVATGASNVQKILQQAYPNAKFYTGADPSKLVIWAKPEEHRKMKLLIADLEEFDSRKRESKAYPIGENVDAQTIAALLSPLKHENVTLTTDTKNNLLVALATPEQHDQIKKAIDQFLQTIPASSKPTSEVYRFEYADPRAAQTVLTALVPKAKIAIDASQKALVVSAVARDHAVIKETVAKMDDPEANLGQKRLKTHLFAKSEPKNLLTVVKAVFQQDNSVNFSMDDQNRVLIAVATQKQHKMIEDLIAQLEGTHGTGKETLEFYALTGGMNVEKVESIVKIMLKVEGLRAQITKETFTNQLIVSAEQKVHRKIGKILSRLELDEPDIEVFQLENIDPEKAAEAIDGLFDNTGFPGKPGAPIISGDDSTGQLYVRATKEQMKKIKDLLRKMGETNLDPSNPASGRKIRKIRIDGDVEKAINDIRRLWPRKQKNPIKVIGSPKDDRVRDARKKVKEEKPKTKIPRKAQSSLNRGNGFSFVSLDTEQKPTHQTVTARKPIGEAQPSSNRKPQTIEQPKTQQKEAPIFIIPGQGQLTIYSEDVEALNEFERLWNSLKPRRGFSGRNFMVFMLRNAGARTIAESLKDLFKSGDGGRIGRGPVVVVPDERLNAVVIYANRSDRATIESLLEILDSEDIIDSKSLVKPRRITVKNTRATRIEQVLRNIYRSQLLSGGGRKPIPIPPGISPELATILQQVNAISTGPLMTLDVDETSNSIIVMAPANLTNEVEALVNDLDEASIKDRPKRGLMIYKLNKINASNFRQRMRFLLQQPTGRRR